MTAFLWTVVILMAVALAAEIFAFVGMALVARRAARRAQDMKEELALKVDPSIRLVKELKLSLRPRLETVRSDGEEIKSLFATRVQAIEAAYLDSSHRAERIRLRLSDGIETVEQQRRHGQRVIHREVVEPIQAVRQVFRGLSFALWLLRKVA
jgi:hypothetical protein